MAKCFRTSVLWLTVLLLPAAPAFGIVEGIETDELFHQPGSGWWYGMNWDYVYETGEGTSVAIGYFSLLTANHYSLGETFSINGDEFEVEDVVRLRQPNGDLPDLRVVKLKNNTESVRPLPGFYPLYTGALNSRNKMVIVGTGISGEIHSTFRYSEDPNTGRARRWGTNQYTQPYTYKNDIYTTETFRMEFRQGDTTYECGYGDHDSGGGVFFQPLGEEEWMLAGINLYREGIEGWYHDIWAASIPAYAHWLNGVLEEDVLPGDADLDGDVDFQDYLRVKASLGRPVGANWRDGDFNHDSRVDRDDLHAILMNFGYASPGHPVMTPPVWPAIVENGSPFGAWPL